MPPSNSQPPGIIKVNHKNKNALSGQWHALDNAPGEIYVSVKMLIEGGIDQRMIDAILGTKEPKGWKP